MRRRTLVQACLTFAGLANSQVITTVAGTTFTFPGDSLPALTAPLGQVVGVAIDSKGNVYASDKENSLVVQIAPNGTLTVVAGNGTMGFSGDGGSATSASLNLPAGVAVDSAGTLYIADYGNGRIRKVSGGIITSFAGGGSVYPGDGGPATMAALVQPSGVAVDSAGNLYIASQNQIRKVSGGIITTVAGNLASGFSGDGGPAISASLNTPNGLTVDPAGNLYIADTFNFRIRKVSGGIITTIAGNGIKGSTGDAGPATSASLFGPTGVAADSAGNIYIADESADRIRKVSGGIIATVSGSGGATGVVLDSAGNIYYTDQFNDRVRKLSSGNVVTIAGSGGFKFSGDGGPATSAALDEPNGVAVDSTGALYISDTRNARIRKVSGGIITTFAGGGSAIPGDGGPATGAYINFPVGVAVDSAGNVYLNGNGRIRKVSGGIITTIAGNGTGGFSGDGGSATNAELSPAGLAVDSAGNVYIADSGNNRIREVSKGIITTIAGNGTAGFSGDGGAATSAELSSPTGVAVDSAGNLYIADEKNNRIRKVSGGIIGTFAGNGTFGFSGDGGPAAGASLSPAGLAVDSTGNLYIADVGSYRIREVSGGIITTIAGNGAAGFSGDGGPATSASLALTNPGAVDGLAVDSAGNVYIADFNNDRVRKILNTRPSFQAAPTSLSFAAVAGGPASPAQTVNLLPSVSQLGFSASASASWLSVSPSTGTMPTSLQVIADPTGLTAGTYTGAITITAPNATPSTASIAVAFTVSPAVLGSLAVSATSLPFSFTQGASPATLQLTISNQGSGSIHYMAAASTTTGGNWLSISGATSGTVTPTSPTSLNVTATPGNLAVGSYSGVITVASSDTGQQIAIPVTLAISAPPQKILLSQVGFTFTAVAQGGTVLPQTLGILNTGAGTLNYNVQATTQPGASGLVVPWLSVSANSGTVIRPFLDVSFVDVNVNASSLTAGTYYGQVTVSAPGASNSPQTAVVVLTVLPAGSNPGPVVSPTGLVFTGAVGAETPGSQNVTVANLTANPTTFGSNVIYPLASGWIKNLPTNATVAPTAPTQIVVQPDFTNLAAGPNRAFLTLGFDDGSVQNVSILAVLAPAGVSSGNEAGRRAAATCAPTKLLPQFKQVGFGLNATVSYPTDVEVDVVDDCGNAMTDGSVTVSFSNGDPPLSLVSLQNGSWTASWQPNHFAGTVALSAQAQPPAGSLSGTAQTTTPLQLANQLPPVLAGLPLGPFAPGDLMYLQGIGLADGQASSSTDPLPQQLAGVSVTVAGGKASLLYADVGHLVALVPSGVPVNGTQEVIVARDNAVGLAAQATITPTHPVVLTKDGNATGQALVYAGGSLADAANPVKSGSTIIVYCTGLGTVDANGNATNIPQLTIGGQVAQVSYAGVALSSNYPPVGAPTVLGGQAQVALGGLYQITATVPTGLPGGPAFLAISSAGQTSASGVTLMIAGAIPNGPVITSINTAYGPAAIGQNDFIEIHGINLAIAAAGPASLITQLGGVSVTVHGQPALLYYVSPSQINALTPLDNTTGPVEVIVTNGAFSASYTANLQTVSPAFLRFNDNAHITATHADGSLLGPASLGAAFTPAKPGETIVTYAVGFGLPASPVVSDSPTQTGVLPALPICQISGAPATVAFAGLNGFAGLFQLNLVVPTGASSGDNVVSCTYSGQTTPAGTLLSVQQ